MGLSPHGAASSVLDPSRKIGQVMPCEAAVGRVSAAAYEIPTDAPEADGTLEWDRRVLVVVEIEAGGKTGLGYTYADGSIVQLVQASSARSSPDIRPLRSPRRIKLCGAAFVISAAAGWRQPRSLPSTPRRGI